MVDRFAAWVVNDCPMIFAIPIVMLWGLLAAAWSYCLALFLVAVIIALALVVS